MPTLAECEIDLFSGTLPTMDEISSFVNIVNSSETNKLAFADQVRATSEADVQRVANRLLSTETASVVVVGPVDGFLSELEELGTVEIRDTHGRPVNLESVESRA